MKRLRWPLLIVVAALIAIAALLIGGQDESIITDTPPVIEPTTGGVYVEGLIGSPGRFNPLLESYNPTDRDINRLLYSGLLRFDDRGLAQPDLADSMGISQDGKIYNLSIRASAVWHDGQPVTSDDVIFTLEWMRDDASPLPQDVRNLWQEIVIVRLDDKTVQFQLPEPFTPFLDYLTFGVLPSHRWGDVPLAELADSPLNLEPVGSGPYQLDHFIVEEGQITGVALRLFEDYYGEKPFIEQFAFRYYPTAEAAFAAYGDGEIMGIGNVSPEILPAVLKEPALNLYTGRLPEMTLVLFNLDNPEVEFFQNASVRRALLLGLNRQWMVDRLLNGQAFLADGPIFPGTWAYFDGVERVGYDSEQAIALLRDAGYTLPADGGEVRQKEGKALEFELLYPDDDLHGAIAEAVRDDWAKLGVSVVLKAVTYDDLLENHLSTRTFQAALVDLNLTRSPDPDPYPFWDQTQAKDGQNYSQWNDPTASDFLEQARIVLDLAERIRLYRNFQFRFGQELPALPLFYPVYNYAVSAEVQGVRMGPLFDPSDRFHTVTGWYLLVETVEGTAVSTPTIAP